MSAHTVSTVSIESCFSAYHQYFLMVLGSSLWNNVERTKMEKFKDSMRNIMSFHQKSKYEAEGQNDEPKKVNKKKKKGFSLPWWTIYIAWVCK